MANLTDPQRVECLKEFVDKLGSLRETIPVLKKSDLRAALDAADAWTNTNTSSYNTALPVAARTNLTASQKALLLAYVIMKRYAVGA